MYKGRDNMQDKLTQFRIDLHQIPETSFTEYKTQSYLKETLVDMGYSPVEIIETGLYVYIDNHQKETIAFRTDIDALPVFEETDLSYQSTHPGFMHACGHDGHMAMMLGVADYLKDKKEKLQKNVLLLFQPAEESIGGAKKIVETGLFKRLNVTAIFGIHLYPEIDEGLLASKPNEFMAMANEVDVVIHGKSAHGAMPHLGVDANIIMSRLLLDFQNIQTRMISPLEHTIITFGKFEGGSVRNQISDYARMEGTIRSFSKSTQEFIVTSMKSFANHYEQLFQCHIEVIVKDGYLPVINHPELYQTFREAITNFNYVEFQQPLMIAEDFSFYQEAVPGVFFFVGTKNPEKGYTYSLHHPKFNFDPTVLQVGVQAYKTLIQHLGVYHE